MRRVNEPTCADALRAEPFTLVMGAGWFGCFAHAGAALALAERDLAPARFVGVSGGAPVAAALAAGIEAAEVAARLATLQRADFWDPGLPLGGLVRGRRLERRVADLLAVRGVRRFEDLERPLALVATDLLARRPLVIERGEIASAVRASCAVPFVLRPVRREGRWLVDGGVLDRPGRSALSDGERVLYHHLPRRGARPSPGGVEGRAPHRRLGGFVHACHALPTLGPRRLDQGARAIEHARASMGAWLDSPHQPLPRSAPGPEHRERPVGT